MRRAAFLLSALAASCSSGDPLGSSELADVLAMRTARVLAPGAVAVVPMRKVSAQLTLPDAKLEVLDVEGGAVVTVRSTSAGDHTIFVSRDGAVHAAEEGAPPAGIDRASRALLLRCKSGRAIVVGADQAASKLYLVALPDGACAGLLAKGSSRDRFVSVRPGGDTEGLVFTPYDVAADGSVAEQASTTVPRDRFAYFPKWAEEKRPGVFAYLALTSSTAGGWTVVAGETPGAPRHHLPGPSLSLAHSTTMERDPARIRRGADGRIEIAGDDGDVYRFDLDGTGTATHTASLPPPPYDGDDAVWAPTYGFAGALAMRSMVNPKTVGTRFALEHRARDFVGSTFQVIPAATTPCTTRSACRLIGESYLLGVVGVGATPVGVWYFWPWEQYGGGEQIIGVFAAPASRAD